MASPSAMEPLKSWADVGSLIGGLSAAIGLIIASIAACLGYIQIRAGKETQREAVARQTYNEYLKLAIQYPNLAAGNQPTDPLEFESYEWFVSYMLNACEQILLFEPNSPEWQFCVRAQLDYHRHYLTNNDWFRKNFLHHYSLTLRSMIAELTGDQE